MTQCLGFPHFPESHARPWVRRSPDEWDFPLFASVGLLVGHPSEHISAVSVCLYVSRSLFLSRFVFVCVTESQKSLRWKSSPKSIYILPHEPGLCPNFTLSTEHTDCLAMVAFFFFFLHTQTVTKLAQQIGYYTSVMVPWCGFGGMQLLKSHVEQGVPARHWRQTRNDHITLKFLPLFFFVCVNYLLSCKISCCASHLYNKV